MCTRKFASSNVRKSAKSIFLEKSSKLFYFSSPSRAMEVRPFIFTNRNSNLLEIHLQIFQILLYILHILTGEYFLLVPLTPTVFLTLYACKRLSWWDTVSLACFLVWRVYRYFYVKTTCANVAVLPAFSCLIAWASLTIYARHLWSNTYYLDKIRSLCVCFCNSSVACLYLITESPKIPVPYLRKSTVWNLRICALLGQISYFLAFNL